MEKIDIFKQSPGRFVFNEFIIFASQVFIFFIVTVFTSDFLRSEDRLVRYAELKINNGSMTELGLTFTAVFVVIGFLSAIGKIFSNKIVDSYIHEILCEIPKTIYFFGSSVTGVMLAISLFIYRNPQPQSTPDNFTFLASLFALGAFMYGCSISYAFKRKTHVISRPNNRIHPITDAPAD